MNKIAALALAVFCGTCFVLSTIWGLYACQGTFLIVGVIFGIIAYSKYRRDAKLVAASNQAQLTAKQPQLPPPMSSPGSSRMFVPPPLQHK